MNFEVSIMSGMSTRQGQVGLFAWAVILFLPAVTFATVYSWKSEEGVLVLSNDLEDVPGHHRETVKKFTSKFAGKSLPVEVISPPPSVEATMTSAYERGLERGLETAERQVAIAGELARTVLAAVPPAPPTRIVIQQSAPIVRYVSPGYDLPFYGFIGPYAPYFPYGFSYAYGFGRGRLVRHSHFFPGTRGRHRGLFFPRGHFSQDGFLFGQGFVVR
jgi:hypothetical protein